MIVVVDSITFIAPPEENALLEVKVHDVNDVVDETMYVAPPLAACWDVNTHNVTEAVVK